MARENERTERVREQQEQLRLVREQFQRQSAVHKEQLLRHMEHAKRHNQPLDAASFAASFAVSVAASLDAKPSLTRPSPASAWAPPAAQSSAPSRGRAASYAQSQAASRSPAVLAAAPPPQRRPASAAALRRRSQQPDQPPAPGSLSARDARRRQHQQGARRLVPAPAVQLPAPVHDTQALEGRAVITSPGANDRRAAASRTGLRSAPPSRSPTVRAYAPPQTAEQVQGRPARRPHSSAGARWSLPRSAPEVGTEENGGWSRPQPRDGPASEDARAEAELEGAVRASRQSPPSGAAAAQQRARSARLPPALAAAQQVYAQQPVSAERRGSSKRSRPRRGQPAGAHEGFALLPDGDLAKRERAAAEVELLRRRQNQHLLSVLEEEQAAEEQRELRLRITTDARERERLELVFGQERARASDRIMRLTEDHEMAIAARMRELGLAPV